MSANINIASDSTNKLAAEASSGLFRTASEWVLSGQVDGSNLNSSYPIHTSPFVVGRRADAHLCLPVTCISKSHAEFTFNDQAELFLEDLGSTNGTFVNGQQLSEKTQIKNGDLIQFAKMILRVGRTAREDEATNTIQENVGDKALSVMQLERLITDGGLFPHFQPIVRLADQEKIGFEILGRSRLFGLQSPQEMFSAASQLDLEAQLSESFRHRGVEIGTSLGPDMNLFVNTHPKELDRDELYESLKQLREIDSEQMITLEIHEAAVTNLTMMKKLCAVLRDLDIKLAFDDFGVGQARLVELGEVRPDFLKFDMKLTKNIHHAPAKRQEVVALFAKLVNNLGIQTLAEGIETLEGHETLLQMGFQLGQGFYYGRPSPIGTYCKADTDGHETI